MLAATGVGPLIKAHNMYNHLLGISVIGDGKLIEKVLAHIETSNHLDFHLNSGVNFDETLLPDADIILFNGLADFNGTREIAKPDACLIACLTPDEENRLSENEKMALNDIWQAPLSEFRLERRINHLFAELNGQANALFLIGCLDTFINSLPDLVWFKDLDGIHRKVNDYFCKFVNKPREEVENSTHEEIWGISETGNDNACQGTDQAAIDSGETVVAEEVVETADGKRLFKTIKTPILGLHGEVLGTVGLAHDITNMLNFNMELELFIEIMPFPLIICDQDDHIIKANAKFLEFFETQMASVLDVGWRDWYEENILHEISPTGEAIYKRFVHADGSISFLKMISHEMNDMFGDYQGVIIVFEDISSEKEQEFNIWKLANTDALTGIANRQAFYEYAKRINRNKKISLFYLDLDNFKQVNDLFGHKAGDEALEVTAATLRQVFGKDFPARLGGDEFIVCVNRDASQAEIEDMAKSLIAQLQERFAASESLSRLSCSIGILYNGSMEEGIESLVKKTDSAMYKAKKRGKAGYVLYDPAETN